jgi:Type III restriction enzyme, res subunit/Helicase conserved C-terminal domain
MNKEPSKKRERCKKGTRKNKDTGKCEPIVNEKKVKRRRCEKGTRKNKETGECEPIVEEKKSFIEQILTIHPTNVSKQNPLLENNPPVKIEVTPAPRKTLKKRKLVVGCSKDYKILDSDMRRYNELDVLKLSQLRKIYSDLIKDPSVLEYVPGIKLKDELIRLIICLENEQKRLERVAVTAPVPGVTLFSRFFGTNPAEITEQPTVVEPTPVVENIEPEEEPIIKRKKLVIREPLPETVLDVEEKIDIHVEEEPDITPPPPSTETIEVSENIPPSEGVEEEKTDPLLVTEDEKTLQDRITIFPNNIESKEYNQALSEKEKLESENLSKNETLDFLYPELNDPNFNIKIAKRKEFNDTQYDGTIYDIKQQAELLCKSDFELLPHQLFVKNFLSMQTPYNSLLLYHQLGTGKTCSSIGIAEEMRAYMKQIGLNQHIFIVASPNVQQNYRLQLFDERKLQLENGIWTSNTCIGNSLLKEINPTNLVGIPKDRIISEVNTIINKHYTFMGYTELANFIKRHTQIPIGSRFSLDEQKKLRIKKIRKYFDNRLIIIDEAHNIRISEDNKEESKTATLLMDIARYANNMRLLLLSATPMYNNYKEILWLTNLMNMIDKRSIINESDIFDKEGNFLPERTSKDGKKIEGGRELLQRKLTGYVSYVRGENPYSFPFRIYPDIFSADNTLATAVGANKYPTKQLNQRLIEKPLNNIPVFLQQIGNYQAKAYDFIMNHLRKKSFMRVSKFGEIRELPSFENMESFGYTLLMQPLEALNIVFPNPVIDALPDIVNEPEGAEGESKEGEGEGEGEGEEVGASEEPYPEEKNEELIKDIIGKRGLYNIMNRKEDRAPIPNIYDFEYKPNALSKYGRIFNMENISKYSSKIAKICDSIRNSEGIVLIYSQYIEGGVIPIALALEEMGFSRFSSTATHINNLFKTAPTEPIDSQTLKPYRQFLSDGGKKEDFQTAKYVMITGNKAFSPDNLADIKHVTNPNNKNGERVKVVLISRAGSEGLDFKCIRQVHILEPWYNMSRIEQIIGRGVRNLSHCSLEFEKRNVEIYLHATLPRNNEEPADLYVYRYAENKALQIGKVTRLLKEIAVDCILNIGQTNFTVEKLATLAQNQNVKIQLSSMGGNEIEYQIGDKPFTPICDYMDNCSFTCSPNTQINETDIVQNTYNDDFLKMNYTGIVKRIRQLFKEHISYPREQLINAINITKKYPISHIDYVLSRFINNKNEYVFDQWGRTGYLINRGQYYVFQPVEITDETISIFERETPIDVKKEYVEIELPKEKAPLILPEEKEEMGETETVETEESINTKYKELIDRLKMTIDIVEEWRNKKREGSRIASGESDWYMNIGYIFDTIIENHQIPEKDIMDFIVYHFLDTLTFAERMIIVKYLYSFRDGGITTSYDELLRTYFDKKVVRVRGYRAVVLINDIITNISDIYLKILVQDNKDNLIVWNEAMPTDREAAIREIFKTSAITHDRLSRLVGFMQVFRNNIVEFKTMDMQNKLRKGSRCGGEGKKDVIKKLNIVCDGAFKYTEDNTEEENLIIKPGMCVILETVMRYYNKIGKNGSVWFLDLETTFFSRLVK